MCSEFGMLITDVERERVKHKLRQMVTRYSTIFCKIGVYKGRICAVKRYQKKYVDITRRMKMDLKALRDLR